LTSIKILNKEEKMKKILIGLICGIIAAGAFGTPVSAISLAPCPEDEHKAECEKEQAEILRRWEAGEPTTKSADGGTGTSTGTDKVAPTFVADVSESEQTAGLWAGKNFLLAGNNVTTSTDVKNGLLVLAGNNLNFQGSAEYGFVFGNIIKFAGSTQRDLYVAGNSITLTDDAQIGRDVFVAGSELRVETDLAGDLSVTADRVIIKDGVAIDGNVNLSADKIEFGNGATLGGKLVYNDSAHVTGLDKIKASETETYHVQELSAEARFMAAVYGKFLSIAGLFLAMALILALYSKLHDKVQTETTAGRFGTNLAVGLGTLIIVPVVACFALLTMVAAPLGIIALLIYGISVYLAQGFTGLWLGHVIVEKLFKAKGNAFIEALIGILILGLLALIPFVGVITGFVSLALGLGLIVSCIKPRKDGANTQKLAKNAKTRRTVEE